MTGKLVLRLIFGGNLPSKTIKFRKILIYLFFSKKNSMIKYFKYIELEYI